MIAFNFQVTFGHLEFFGMFAFPQLCSTKIRWQPKCLAAAGAKIPCVPTWQTLAASAAALVVWRSSPALVEPCATSEWLGQWRSFNVTWERWKTGFHLELALGHSEICPKKAWSFNESSCDVWTHANGHFVGGTPVLYTLQTNCTFRTLDIYGWTFGYVTTLGNHQNNQVLGHRPLMFSRKHIDAQVQVGCVLAFLSVRCVSVEDSWRSSCFLFIFTFVCFALIGLAVDVRIEATATLCRASLRQSDLKIGLRWIECVGFPPNKNI